MSPAPCRRRVRIIIALLSLLPACFGAVTAQTLLAHVIAGGGGISRSSGGCRSLEGNMGETATGSSSNAGFTLHAGFWAGAGSVDRDSLFRSGFEACQ
jgi:hypothetical protein